MMTLPWVPGGIDVELAVRFLYSSTSVGGSDGGTDRPRFFFCNGVPFGGGGALFLMHSGSAFTGVLGYRLEERYLHACFFVFFHCLQRKAGVTPSGERKGVRFNNFTIRKTEGRPTSHTMFKRNHNSHR